MEEEKDIAEKEAEEDYLPMHENRNAPSETSRQKQCLDLKAVHDYDDIELNQNTLTSMEDNAPFQDTSNDAVYSTIQRKETKKTINLSNEYVPAAGRSEGSKLECSKLIIFLVVVSALGAAVGVTFLVLELSKLKGEVTALQKAQLNVSANESNEVENSIFDDVNRTLDTLFYKNISEELFAEFYTQLSSEMMELNLSLQMVNTKLNEGFVAIGSRTQQLIDNLGALVQSESLPLSSCAALPIGPASSSGYYWVRASNGSAVRVYCDITSSCGGVTGGWVRVAELDMTNSSHQCPNGLTQHNVSSVNDSDTPACIRNEESAGCSSVNIHTFNLQYSVVCGAISAYQFGTTNAFGFTGGRRIQSETDINGPYVDGISLTHGIPRQHIWTFAAGLFEGDEYTFLRSSCPCTTPQATPPPQFVGSDYFCDTGAAETFQETLYTDDPLWDGAGCGPLNACCSFNNPPWFYKQLPQPTTDDIEMRVCRDEDASNEDIAIERVVLYIQ